MTQKTRQRTRRLQRLLRAQEAMAVAERAHRAEAEHGRTRCEADGEAILEALSGETPLYGMMLPTMGQMLQANAKKAAHFAKLSDAAREREAAERLRAEQIARKARAALREDRLMSEAQRLEDIGIAWAPAHPRDPDTPQ